MNTRPVATSLARNLDAASNCALPKPCRIVRLAGLGTAAAVTALVVANQLGPAQHDADGGDGVLAAAPSTQLAGQGAGAAPAQKS